MATQTRSELETWRLLKRAHAMLAGTIERDLEAAGMPPLSWLEVLSALGPPGEGQLRIHELADAVVLSRSGLSRLLDRMEAVGLVRRESCKLDRRGAFAVITDEGRATLTRMEPVQRRALEEHFGPQLRDQAGAVRESLARVVDSAQGECPTDDEP